MMLIFISSIGMLSSNKVEIKNNMQIKESYFGSIKVTQIMNHFLFLFSFHQLYHCWLIFAIKIERALVWKLGYMQIPRFSFQIC